MIRMTRMLLRACYGAGASCIVHLQCSLLLREAISEGAAGRISAMTLCLSLANVISRSRLAHVTSLGSVEGASVEAWIAFLYACLANFKSQGGPVCSGLQRVGYVASDTLVLHSLGSFEMQQ
jgi:hypothetical protein